MDSGTEALSPDVYVYDHALGFVGQASVAVGHGQGDHFVGAGDYAGKLGFLLILAFDYGFDDGGVVAAEVDKDVSYPGLGNNETALLVVLLESGMRVMCTYFP